MEIVLLILMAPIVIFLLVVLLIGMNDSNGDDIFSNLISTNPKTHWLGDWFNKD